MKRIVSILLIFAFVFQCIGGLAVMVNFYMNRTEIAQTICVNRFEAIPICKGQCFLDKQLKKTEKQEKKTSSQKEKEIQSLPLIPIDLKLAKEEVAVQKSIPTKNQIDRQFSLIYAIFHPPQG